jgi:hypothetical protein
MMSVLLLGEPEGAGDMEPMVGMEDGIEDGVALAGAVGADDGWDVDPGVGPADERGLPHALTTIDAARATPSKPVYRTCNSC